MVNSPVAYLSAGIDDVQTTIPVDNVNKLPVAPNLATIGSGEDAETILYQGVDTNNSQLTNVTRGFQGAAKAWEAGTPVARTFTAYDWDAIRQNLDEVAGNVTGLESVLGDANKQSITLPHGLSVINADQAGLLDVKVEGRTLVNLLGKDGNCEDLSKWLVSNWGSGTITVTEDATTYLYGSKSVKLVASEAMQARYQDIDSSYVNSSKYYVAIADVYIASVSGSDNLQLTIYDSGGFANGVAMYADTTKLNQWQQLIVKFTGKSGARIRFGNTSFSTEDGITGYFDGIRLYEIPQSVYDKIDVDQEYTGEKLVEKFPYVDSVQHLMNPVVKKWGKNLVNQLEWLPSSLISYDGEFFSKDNDTSVGPVIKVPVIPGQNYTLSAVGYVPSITTDMRTIFGAWKDKYGNIISGTLTLNFKDYTAPTKLTHTVTAPEGAVEVWVYPIAQNGTVYFKDVQLELGSAATGFEPANPDYLYAAYDSAGNPIKLASNNDGTVVDQLYQRDGQWYRLNRFERDMALDGSFGWLFGNDYTGSKRVYITVNDLLNFDAAGFRNLVKYDGKVLPNVAVDGGDKFYYYSGAQYLYVGVFDADSGWTDAMTPTTNMIKGYFNGWKYTGDGTNHSWVSIVDSSAPTQQTEAYVAENMAPGFTPYKLTYKLAEPYEEPVTVEGAINLHEGGNQLELSEAVIVREKIAAKYESSTGNWWTNNTSAGYEQTLFSCRTEEILGIYKNGELDPSWVITSVGATYGKQNAYIKDYYYDPTAEYVVTYIALDKYMLSTNLVEVDVAYNTNIKTVVDLAVQDIADLGTRQSVLNARLNTHLADTAQSNDVHGLKTLFQNQQFTNLLKNGDFASWSRGDNLPPDGWFMSYSSQGDGAVSKDATKTVDGTDASVKVTNGTSGQNWRVYQVVPTVIGRTYTVWGYFAGDSTGVSINIGTGYSSDSTYKKITSDGTGNFKLFNATFTATAEQANITLYVLGTGVGTGWLGLVMMVEGELPVAFANHPNDQHLKAVDYQDSAGTNYEYGLLRMETGVADITFSNQDYSYVDVTFGEAFSKILTVVATPGNAVALYATITSFNTTGFQVYLVDREQELRSGTFSVNWIAVGVG